MADPAVAKIEPGDSEGQDAFISRCMSAEKASIPDNKQRLAACFSMWRRKKGGGSPKETQRFLSVFNVAQGLELRREQLDGREHVVLPMVALLESVFQCANCSGPNFYPAAEFGKNVGAWNGRPVTIGHPMRGDSFVSAGSPDVWETERIGTTFNARLDGGRLLVEAWVDPAAAERAGPDAQAVIAAAEAGEQVEVSTAAWIDELPKFGTHNGRKYDAVQANFQPDHVALLRTGEVGACSWADGCGVRVASSADQTEPCCEACARGEPCDGCGPADLQSAKSLESAIQIALEDKVGRTGYAFIVDWDDEYVYYGGEGRGLSRCSYTQDDAGNVVLGEDVERVRPRMDYVVNQEDGEMADDPRKAAAPETPPADDEPKAAEARAPEKPRDEKPPKAAKSPEVLIAELQGEIEWLKERDAKRSEPRSIEEYIAEAPAEFRPVLASSIRAAKRRQLELIELIRSAPGCMYDEDELKAMEVKDLERLVALAARTHYGVRPPERAALDETRDFAMPKPSAWDPKKPDA